MYIYIYIYIYMGEKNLMVGGGFEFQTLPHD